MDKLLADGLIDVLKNEMELYKEVLKLSNEKTNVIVEGKTAELENITKKEQAFILQISKLDELREKIVGKFSEYYKKSSSELTLSVIAGILPSEKGDELRAILKALTKLLNEIKEVNALNSKLIRNSLEYIDFSINLLTGAEEVSGLYGNSGQSSDGKKRNFLDVKL